MSLSLVHSRALLGLEARPVCVEVHLANGLPSFTLVACQLDSCQAHLMPLGDRNKKGARRRLSPLAGLHSHFPNAE